MIKFSTVSGDVVRAPDGRIGLVTGWITDEFSKEEDKRQAGIVMRRGPNQPFDWHFVPIKTYLETFFHLGSIEQQYQDKLPIHTGEL